MTNRTFGCTNQTLDCNHLAIVGIIAGLTAGVIAAIILAALACAALAGGGAYAVNNSINKNSEAQVIGNPLYVGAQAEQSNPLHTAM